MSKSTKRTLSIVSICVFVGCVAATIANFNLWWLPVAALPFLFYGNWNFNGTWESEKVDEAAEKMQEDEPYKETWPFSSLEASPTKDYEKEEERLEDNPHYYNRKV